MKHDLDRLRGRLERFATPSKGGWLIDQPPVVEEVLLLREAGLVDARIEEDEDGARVGATVFCVTPTGRRFLDDSRDGVLWTAVKERCGGSLRAAAETLARVNAARSGTALAA